MKRYRRRPSKKRPQQRWHHFLAKGFELSVGRRGVLVIAEIEVTQNPPKVTDLSDELLNYFEVLRALWSLPEGATMKEVLTPERVLEIGQILFQHATADELEQMLSPESKQKLIEQEVKRGIERGIEQRINQKTRDIVLAMRAKGFDLAVIADITELSMNHVQALLQAEEAKPTP